MGGWDMLCPMLEACTTSSRGCLFHQEVRVEVSRSPTQCGIEVVRRALLHYVAMCCNAVWMDVFRCFSHSS